MSNEITDEGTIYISPSKQGDTFYLSFMYSPSQPKMLDEVTFYPLYRAKSSDLNPTSFNWDFGDGTTSTEKYPTHKYIAPGEYLVVLTASSDFATNVYSKYIYIDYADEKDPLAPPVAIFTVNHVYSFVNQELQFYNESYGSHSLSYEWDFGDGTTSTDINPIHKYEKTGNYKVCLTAIDTVNNLTSTYCISIPIVEIPDEYDFLLEVLTGFNFYSPNIINPFTYTISVNNTLFSKEILSAPLDYTLEVLTTLGYQSNDYVLDINTDIDFKYFKEEGKHFELITRTSILAYTEIKEALSFVFDFRNEINFTQDIVSPDNLHLPPRLQILQSEYTGFIPFTVNFLALTDDTVTSIKWFLNEKQVSQEKSFRYNFNESGVFKVKCLASNKYGTSIAVSFVYAMISNGKYYLKTDLFYYYYLMDRTNNFIYIFDMKTNEEIKRFGGTGKDIGKFLKLMSMDISKPQKFITIKNQKAFWR